MLKINKKTESSDKKLKKKRAINSKKHVIKKLAPNWASNLFDIQQQISKNQPDYNKGDKCMAIAILISTGLRPEELEQGVILSVNQEKQLVVEISGAKIAKKDEFGRPQRGIEKRWLTINPEYSSASNFLFYQTRVQTFCNGQKPISFKYSKSMLRKAVRTLGKKYLEIYQPKQKDLQISPYCFRHLMAANIKSCTTFTDIERAQILGHLSIRSMEDYAKAFRSKSPVKPILSVSASQVPHYSGAESIKKLAKLTTHQSSPREPKEVTTPQLMYLDQPDKSVIALIKSEKPSNKPKTLF